MVLVTDPICSLHKEEHLTFNRQLIALFKDSNGQLRYGWCGDNRYGEELFKNHTNVDHYAIAYRKRYNATEGWRRYWHIFQTIRTRKTYNTVVFLSFENTFFPLFCLLFLPSLSGRKIICVIHNNLKTLKESTSKRSLFRLLGHLLKINFAVLTARMKEHADPILKTSTVLLHHPFFSASERDETIGLKSFLALGRQGAIFHKNGFYPQFIEACELYRQHHNEKIKIIIGVEEKNNLALGTVSNVEVQVLNGFIAASDYTLFYRQANFVLFADSQEAEYRASGTLMDTLSAGGIFIAPFTGHFAEFPECGILYKEGGFRDAVLQALCLTKAEIEAMRAAIQRKRMAYEYVNRRVLSTLLVSDR